MGGQKNDWHNLNLNREVLKRYLQTLAVSNTSKFMKRCVMTLLYQIQAAGLAIMSVGDEKYPRNLNDNDIK